MGCEFEKLAELGRGDWLDVLPNGLRHRLEAYGTLDLESFARPEVFEMKLK